MCRRGAKEADELILELVRIADAVRGDTNKHMAHEEQEVLPLLEAHLCAAEQRAMVWRTLRAMPLRLLERVMPWVAGTYLLHSVDCLDALFAFASCQPVCLRISYPVVVPWWLWRYAHSRTHLKDASLCCKGQSCRHPQGMSPALSLSLSRALSLRVILRAALEKSSSVWTGNDQCGLQAT